MKSFLEQSVLNNDPALALEALNSGETPTQILANWACGYGHLEVFRYIHKHTNLLDNSQFVQELLIVALNNNQFAIAGYIFKQYPETNFLNQVRKMQEKAARSGNWSLLEFILKQDVKKYSIHILVDIATEAHQAQLIPKLLAYLPEKRLASFCNLVFFRAVCRHDHPLMAMLFLDRNSIPVQLPTDKEQIKIMADAVTQKGAPTAMTLCMLSIWRRQQDIKGSYLTLDKYIKKHAPASRKFLNKQIKLYSQLFLLLDEQHILSKDLSNLFKVIMVSNFLEPEETAPHKKSKSQPCNIM